LALELTNDAIYLEADEVAIVRHNGWFLVSASNDWILRDSKWSIEEVFFRLHLFHTYRQNASRATVLIAALAHDVVTFMNAVPMIIQGCEEGVEQLTTFVQQRFPTWRVVAFKSPCNEQARGDA